jgi:hypothetical protein
MQRLFTAASLALMLVFPATLSAAALESATGAGTPDPHRVRAGQTIAYTLEAATPLGAGGSGRAPKECSDSAYDVDPGDYVVEGRFEYYFLADTTPSYLNRDKTEDAVKESVVNWAKATNSCGLKDDVSLTGWYMGRADGALEITSDGQCKQAGDGRSETGFGSLPSGSVAVACVWIAGGKPPYRVISADVRLNSKKSWWNKLSTCGGSRYVVEAALTHERGHIFGLSHHKKVTESAHGNLTMSPSIQGFCEAAETTLGKGDVLGMRALGY